MRKSKKLRPNEEAISILEDFETDSLAEADAVESACNALAFSQSLWDLFGEQGLHDGGPTPDYSQMENIVDALYGELAAACLFLASHTGEVADHLEGIAENLTKKDPKHEEVPLVIKQGYRRFAKRLRNTRTALEATSVSQKNT